MNFDIKCKHIVIGFYHEDNMKIKTLNDLIYHMFLCVWSEISLFQKLINDSAGQLFDRHDVISNITTLAHFPMSDR